MTVRSTVWVGWTVKSMFGPLLWVTVAAEAGAARIRVAMTGSGRVRLGDAERDALAEALGQHYVAGRLDAEALTARVETVYGAEFRDEAEAAVADLPAPDPAAAPPPKPRRSWLRRRGHGESEQAQPGWRPTPERFRDPTTDRIMRVWIDPADGARHYVAEEPA